MSTGLLHAQSAEKLDFLAGLPDFARIRNMLPEYLSRLAESQLEERRRQIAQISTPEDARRRKAYVRAKMLQDLGGLPDRTPLNARTVGVLERDGYRIEKVIFESQPQFYVTANLYRPTRGQPPYPAVLFPLGHERGGKANPTWQQILVTLAKRGYMCLDWDPIGQGERVQVYDPDFESSKVSSSTTEHTIQGIQCLLAGDALARYTIWDGIRALDYLLSRPEVDSTRVACTGNSGGGTHTAYLSALDDRIQVAMPSCYLTSWGRLLETIGPQDAEQCIPGWLRDGLDHADFVYAFAPKPYLILSAIRDFFSISGARETYQEAQRIYSVLGVQEKLSMFEADDGHGYTQFRRQAAYRWLSRWLKGVDDAEAEAPVEPESEESLRCTASGQVVVSLGGETISSLNLKRAKQGMPIRAPLTTAPAVAAHRDGVEQQVRQLTGYGPPTGSLGITPYGQIARPSYRIEKLTYESEPGIIVPALLFVPAGGEARKPAVIYVHETGKSAGAEPGGEIEQLMNKGFVVLAIDMRGTGETRPVPNDEQADEVYRFFGRYDSAMTALLLGKTLVGMRAGDVARGVDLLAARPQVDPGKIYGYGVGSGALVLLHAAVIDDRIQGLFLEKLLESYESVVSHRLHRDVFESVVPGVLKAYDVPDLVAALAPRPVWVTDAVDPLGKRVALAEIQKEYARASEAFKTLGAQNAFHIAMTRPEEKLGAIF
jgi:cephalosporin-C deacetylase-like acetyl esterase